MSPLYLPHPAAVVSRVPDTSIKPELIQPQPIHLPFTQIQQASFAVSPTLYSDPKEMSNNIIAHDGTVSEEYNAGETSNGKRVDRKRHSRMNQKNSNTNTNVTRRDGEAGRRYDHACALGMLQQALLATNPLLAETAVASYGTRKHGWSKLKTNNVCWDVKKDDGFVPLLYNKMDIFGTSRLIHEQSNAMIDDILSELSDDFYTEAPAGCDSYFTRKLADLIKRITKARETRGEDGWLSPKQLLANQEQAAASHVQRDVQSGGLTSAVQ